MTTAKQAAQRHRTNSRSVIAVDKAAPDFSVNELYRVGGSFRNILDSSHGQDRLAYQQFKRTAFVCINAIAKRLAGYETCAGAIENIDPGRLRRRGVKMGGGWYKVPGEKYRRQIIRPDAITNDSTRQMLFRGMSKAPSRQVELLEDHEVLQLMDMPNHVQHNFEFIYFMVANLLATGEGWFAGGDSMTDEGKKTELWAIPSTWVDVEHNGGLFTDYYLRPSDGTTGRSEPMPPGSINRVYFPDPSDPRKVTSPLLAIWEAIKTDESLQKAQKSSFDQGIFPKIAVGVGQHIDHTGKPVKQRPVLEAHHREQLVSAIQEIWMSTAGDGLPAVLDGLIESVHVLQSTPVEMDYTASSAMIEQRIFKCFGLNPVITGQVENANKATALVAERQFQRNVLHPIAHQISVALTTLLNPWYDRPTDLAVWLNKEEMPDEDLTVSKWQFAVKENIATGDEYRKEMLGVEPLEEDQKEESRSPLLNKPEGVAALQSIVSSVAGGLLSYDAAVRQVALFFEVDDTVAKELLGDEPDEESIAAYQALTNPLAQQEEDPEGDDDGGDDMEPGEAPEDSDPPNADDDDTGQERSFKKKRLKFYSKAAR